MSQLQSTLRSAPAAPPARRPLIGCAGWGIPKDAAAAFPLEGSHLERYAAVFPAVEINSSFYRPHQPQTYARWAASVPPGFRFSVKLPKAITHEAKLHDVDDLLDRFAREAGELGARLGCVLVQLAPSAAFDADVVADFLPRLRARFGCQLACEARHPTWFDDDATALLRAHGVTRVQADPAAGQPGPHVPTTGVSYLRLHGTPRVYYSSYGAAALQDIERRVAQALRDHDADCWCIFDNTAEGHALPNALDVLRALDHANPCK